MLIYLFMVEMENPTSFERIPTGPSYTVDIKLQYGDQCIPMKVTNSTPQGGVEARARVMLGLGVEFDEAQPIIWVAGRVYKLRKITQAHVPVIQASTPANLTADVVQEAKVKITMRYSVVHVTMRNILIPLAAAARDAVDAWWAAVDRQHVTDPNITCLPRDWNEHDICDEDGELIEGIVDDAEIFLSPKNKTSPEVISITITWDAFDASGLPLKLSISPKVHSEESRSRLLVRWIEHYGGHPEHTEIASQLFTNENEHTWQNHANQEAVPPWKPAQQVSFKLKPWTKENTAARQRTRPQPSLEGRQDPLGPFLHIATPGEPATDQAGTNPEPGQYQSNTRKLSTRKVNITVEAEGTRIRCRFIRRKWRRTLSTRLPDSIRLFCPAFGTSGW
jgi:hypothetical protein